MKKVYLSPQIRVRSLESDLMQNGINQASTGDTNINYGGEGGDDDEPRAKWGNLWDDWDDFNGGKSAFDEEQTLIHFQNIGNFGFRYFF